MSSFKLKELNDEWGHPSSETAADCATWFRRALLLLSGGCVSAHDGAAAAQDAGAGEGAVPRRRGGQDCSRAAPGRAARIPCPRGCAAAGARCPLMSARCCQRACWHRADSASS